MNCIPSRFILMVFTIIALNSASRAADAIGPLPKPVESFDAGMLHVQKFGAGGRNVILIPGLSSGPWVWRDTIAKLSPTCTIYAITLPGFDGRPASQEKSLFAAFKRDFAAMLD